MVGRYIIRLDDACEKMDIEKWTRMEKLLDKYGIHPLVGIIPHCEDTNMDKYSTDPEFWKKVKKWSCKGWTIALHGYNHVYTTTSGGLNPVNERSEFAGESLEKQREKIKRGISVFLKYGIDVKVFFAPSHTFDINTLRALKLETNIRIISDTIAWDTYYKDGFYFVPQQSGRARKLPFKIVTFCYHPNTMDEVSFKTLEKFLENQNEYFQDFPKNLKIRKFNFLDWVLQKIYFIRKFLLYFIY